MLVGMLELNPGRNPDFIKAVKETIHRHSITAVFFVYMAISLRTTLRGICTGEYIGFFVLNTKLYNLLLSFAVTFI